LADDSEVGKVSLGLELGDSSPIEKQIASVGNKSGNIFAKTMQGAMRSVMKGFKSSVKPVTVEAPKVDNSQLKADIEYYESLSAGLNHKIDLQQQKLEGLKESLKSTFNDDRKSKLEQQISNADVQILRMGRQADTAYDKMLKLKSQLADTGQTANQAAPKMDKVTTSLTNISKPLKSAKGNFNAAARAATRTSKSFAIAGKSSNKMGNQFTQAFSRIAKQVLVFGVIYKAIRGVQTYMNSSMKTNHEYAASLNAIKTNLATAFQPVFSAVMPAINSFMSWLAKATAYIAAFMASLFGTSYKQSFAAAKGLQQARKEMDGLGKSAKKAKKEAMGLSALDDFNLIKTQEDKDKGGGAKPGDWNMEMPDLDIDAIQSKTDGLVANMKSAFNSVWDVVKLGWKSTVDTFGPTFATAWMMIKPELDKWKTSFQQVFSDILSLGEPLKSWWDEHVIPLWQNSMLTVTHILAGLSDSVRMIFDSIWSAVFPILQLFVTDGLPRITEFVNGVWGLLKSLFDVVKKIFDDIWKGVVDPVIKLIAKIIRDALDIIFGWWNDWGVKIVEGIKLALDKVKELWDNLFSKFLKPIIDSALKMLSGLWDKHLKGLVKEILNFISILVKAALDIFNKFVMPIVNWLVKTLGPIFAEVFDGIMRVIGSVLGGIIDAVKGIIKALGGIIDFIAGVFTGDWKRAWNGIKTFFQGIGDAIIGIFKGAVNAVIDAINWMLRQLNKVNIDFPDWMPVVGGKNLGFKIPEIPKLANGGLVSAPTLAMVGDNRNASIDPEVVTPLSKLQDMLAGNNAMSDTLLMSMLEVLKEIAKKNPSLIIGETELGRVATKSSNRLNRINGRTALEV